MLTSVSVIVPCYNAEKTLLRCLESIQRQTLHGLEIICINEGSTDGTGRILDRLQYEDSRIHFIEKAQRVYGHALNLGLEHAHGKYVAIVEAEHFLDPDMLGKMYNAAEEKCLDLVRCGYDIQDENGVISQIEDELPKNTVFTPRDQLNLLAQTPRIWTQLYNTRWLKEQNIHCLGTPGKSYQDYSFSFKCYAAAQRFMVLDEVLYHAHGKINSAEIMTPNQIYALCAEYKEIRNTIHSNPKLNKKIHSVITRQQYEDYCQLFNILEKKHRYDFILRWARELHELIHRGEMDGKFFTSAERRRLFCLHYFPWMFKYTKKM